MKYFKQLLTLISPRLNIRYTFKKYHGYYPDLSNPKSLDEKIQWMKLHLLGNAPIYTRCADKYAVRDYVREKGLGALLVPLLGVYDRVEDISWDSLPQQFVMKYNFGNGLNIVCRDKSDLSPKGVKKKLRRWDRRKPHLTHAEMQYKGIPHKILVEQFLTPEEGQDQPADYKIYCFNGQPYCCMICTERASGRPLFQYVDRQFQRLHIEYGDEGALPIRMDSDKISEMYEYAKVLSADFPFVRVDFYLSSGKIYFGELTFSPAGGHDRTRLPEQDQFLGSLLQLPHTPI